MTLEELVRDAIADHTAGPVPEPDLDAITARRRPRRPMLVPLVAAAVALGMIGTGVVIAEQIREPRTSPAPANPPAASLPTATTPPPTPSAPRGLRIHLVGETQVSIGGATFPRRASSGKRLTAATAYGLVSLGDDLRPYVTGPDGKEEPIGAPTSTTRWRPTLVADPDGSTVAWTSMGRIGSPTAHVYDLAQRRETARIPNAALLTALDDDVLFTERPEGGGSSFAYYLPGSTERTYLELGGGKLVGAAGHRLFVMADRGTSLVEAQQAAPAGWQVVRVDPDSVPRRSTSPDDQLLSPDGRLRLRTNASGGAEAVDVVTGDATALDVPAPLTDPQLAFDVDGSPLVLGRTGDGWTLYVCAPPRPGAAPVRCRAKDDGDGDATFPGDSNYLAPWPSDGTYPR